VDGVISNKDFKIFSKPVPPTETDDQLRSSRFFGGVEDNIAYGDVLEHVNFDYVKKLTSVNAISLASLAWAPPGPEEVKIGGIVQPAAELRWSPVEGAEGYNIYGRDTTSPTWDYSRFVGAVTEHTREGIVIDNYFFGLAAVSENGHGSAVVFTRKYLEIKQIYHV
ncbi:MAG: hypothetical protein KJN76_00775, partial [Eudoraea sp.]|nr:hypothetical protein [Eudoraea sp.]